jgi:hypothetical protein
MTEAKPVPTRTQRTERRKWNDGGRLHPRPRRSEGRGAPLGEGRRDQNARDSTPTAVGARNAESPPASCTGHGGCQRGQLGTTIIADPERGQSRTHTHAVLLRARGTEGGEGEVRAGVHTHIGGGTHHSRGRNERRVGGGLFLYWGDASRAETTLGFLVLVW